MSNDDRFGADLLRQMRAMSKDVTDAVGIQIADSILDAVMKDKEAFTEGILKPCTNVPTYFIYDIFESVGKRLADRIETETEYYRMEQHDRKDA